MEEKKNSFYQTEGKKFYFNPAHKSVNFTIDSFKKLVPQLHLNYSSDKKNNLIDKADKENLTNNKNIVSITNSSNINNTNANMTNTNSNKGSIFSPTRTHSNFIIKSSIRKQSFQTKNFFYNALKNNSKENNNNESSPTKKLSPNINTISNSFKNNPNSLKRTQTGKFINTFTLSNNNAFSNHKLYNKIKFRNSKNYAYDSYKLSNALLKSDGEEKSITTLLTDRNKKEHIKFSSFSRRSSIKNIQSNKNLKRTKTLMDTNIHRKSITFPKKSKFSNKRVNSIVVNPLLISEEDKIFDEMKKYLCFKYEQRLLNKIDETKKNNEKNKINASKLKKIKNKIQTRDQIKLEYLYLSTTKINKKIKYVKRKKDRQELTEYQNNLLDVIKPYISDYTYNHLKDRLIQIRLKNNKKYQNNYKRLKEIENEEEDVINEFNDTCEKCLKTFKRIREQKEIIHSTNLKIKLPLLNFISCLKKKKKQIKKK